MNILFISSRFPYPAYKGDQVILYHRLKYLSKRHSITLLTFYHHDHELQNLDQIKPFCTNIETVKMSPFESVLNVLLFSAFSRLPLQTLYFRSNKFKRKLERIMDATDFDIVHTYMLRLAEFSRHIDKIKVLELIDCMQLNLGKRLAFFKNPQKIIYGEELKRIKRYEREVLDEYDASVVVSDTDRNYIDSNNTATIPLGIDTDRYKRTSPLPDNRTIIFSGNMSYHPNESAILWFLNHCFEPIRRQVPDVKLKIVGISPGSRIRKYHDGQTIIVTGLVKSISDEMATAQVAIAPMQSGYGMHIKILEAMSCGLPVVATSSGRGTIPAEHQVHLLVADDCLSFAEACIALLTDRNSAAAIGKNARDFIVREYSWESSVVKLENIYESLMSKGKERNHARKMQNFQ